MKTLNFYPVLSFAQGTLRGTYLFITNGRLPLRLLVVVGILFKLLDRLRLDHLGAELDVALCVFMAGL